MFQGALEAESSKGRPSKGRPECGLYRKNRLEVVKKLFPRAFPQEARKEGVMGTPAWGATGAGLQLGKEGIGRAKHASHGNGGPATLLFSFGP